MPPFWATIHPPFHMTPEDKFFYRNDTANFPYLAYHYYCVPDNAKHLEQPVSTCDPNNNPKAQEIVQLLSDPIWDACDYPTKKGDGCGLGIQGFGNLMLVECLVDSSFIRSMIDFCISLLFDYVFDKLFEFLGTGPWHPSC